MLSYAHAISNPEEFQPSPPVLSSTPIVPASQKGPLRNVGSSTLSQARYVLYIDTCLLAICYSTISFSEYPLGNELNSVDETISICHEDRQRFV